MYKTSTLKLNSSRLFNPRNVFLISLLVVQARTIAAFGSSARPVIAPVTAAAFSPGLTCSSSLSSMTTTYGTPSSLNGSVLITGSNMTAYINVTAPAGYEVGISAVGGFASAVTVGQSGPNSQSVVYVRLKATQAAGAIAAETLSVTSTGATTVNVSIPAGRVNTATLPFSFTITPRAYNGTTAVPLTSGVQAMNGDVITISYTTPVYTDPTAVNNKAVTITGLSVQGANAANYTPISTSYSTTGTINPALLTVSAAGINKPYDGTTTGTATLTDNRISGDVFTTTYTANFTNPNAASTIAENITAIAIVGGASANYSLTATIASTTAKITTIPLTVTATGINKSYDGTLAGTATLADNRITGDSFITTYTGTFISSNASSPVVENITGIAITGGASANYVLTATTASTSANITPKLLTVIATGINKVYNRSTSGTATLTDNRITGDVFNTTSTSTTFGSANAAPSVIETVSGIGINSGAYANYQLSSTTAATSAQIYAAPLTVIVTGINKPYDGTTTGTVTLTDNRVSGDVFITAYTGLFASSNVANAIPETITGISVNGGASANYLLSNTTGSTTANITARPLIINISGVNKPYDGMAVGTVALIDNRIAGDLFTTAYTSTFASVNIGNTITERITGIAITGGAAANYMLTGTTGSTTANITARPLTITATGINKTYNGTVAGTATLTDNRVTGDIFTTTSIGALFAAPAAGVSVPETVSGLAISGGVSGNYKLQATTASTTATILAAPLTITAVGINKVYDGTLTGTATLTDNRVTGDIFTTSYTGTFVSPNAGNNIIENITGITLAGGASANYSLTAQTAAASANIIQKSLTITAAGVNKVYDGTPAGTVTLSDNRISGDIFNSTYMQAIFVTKNTGAAIAESISGIAIAGIAAGNYLLANTTAQANAMISAAPVTVTAFPDSKVYTGTIISALLPVTAGLMSGDKIATAPVQVFSSANAGQGIILNASGLMINDGNNGADYQITYVPASAGIITPAVLIYTAIAASWNQGIPASGYSGSVSGFIGTDNLANASSGTPLFTATATAASTAGSYAITGSGLQATNYTFAQAPGNAAALTIMPALLSNIATLSSLTISQGVLTPSFSSAITNYNIAVANDINSLDLTPLVSNLTATVKINGTSGVSADLISLIPGANLVNIVVTAQDGVTKVTYLLTVTRSLIPVKPIISIEPANLISPNGDGKNDLWTVANILHFPNNSVKVYSTTGVLVFQQKGYTNTWNGSYRGAPLPNATYYWVVDLGNGIIQKGFLTILH